MESNRVRGLPLQITSLAVRYGELTAVSGLHLEVRPGEIYGLLGSNGAGKSSTLRCVVGLQEPTGGTIRVFGEDPVLRPQQARELVGYVPESPLLFDALSPHEFLEFIAGVRRLPAAVATARTGAYLSAFGIEEEAGRPLATLSLGTRQKVLLVAALLHQPPLLVLDEPFNNLDPRTVRIAKELLAGYVRDAPRGILLSTHTMEIAEALCHRIGILDHGEMRAEGTLPELSGGRPGGAAGGLEEVYLSVTRSEEMVRESIRHLREV
ncbi:MAG: ABC transporter ATP-binding protein [Thermoplasmata archaeon]